VQPDRPRLLDLFCGAGGAAMGYHRAGFDVTGIDTALKQLRDGTWADDKAMPARYPFEFIKADAMTYPLNGFDAIHASPPCQDHSISQNMTGKLHGTGWMLGATRERLQASGIPWVIENVPGAPMRADYVLCGCMVGLPQLKRERWFETSWGGFSLRAPCRHDEAAIPIAGHGVTSYYRRRYGSPPIAARRAAMGIDWAMDRDHLAQAIPPAYTEYVGAQLLEHLAAGRAA
jgi:DNA (cytosine-5)-methyltransferase 1